MGFKIRAKAPGLRRKIVLHSRARQLPDRFVVEVTVNNKDGEQACVLVGVDENGHAYIHHTALRAGDGHGEMVKQQLTLLPVLRETKLPIYWSVGDVLDIAKEEGINLTEREAFEELTTLCRDHDATVGINWEVIRSHLSFKYK